MRTHRRVWPVIIAILFAGTLFFAGHAAVSVAQPGTDCLIKGIIGSTGQKMYVIPGHYLYNKVTPDLNKGERWFCEASGAERAGFVFVPDPTNRDLRPQEATPTPLPTATPEPQPTEAAEPTVAENETVEAAPEPEPTEPPTPVPPTATPEPAETEEPEPDFTSTDPFTQPENLDLTQEQLDQLLEQLPPEFVPFARAFIELMPTLIWAFYGTSAFIWLMVSIVRWKLFVKAGEPGWAAIIPIYSEVLVLKLAGLAWWWILIGIVPVVNLAFMIVWVFIRPFKLAENFGKGFLYGLGLFFFPFSMLFWLHLAFSDSQYTGS